MRDEAQLVKRFEDYLHARGHQTGRKTITPPVGPRIMSDICDLTDRTLYEAKANSSREAIRMALGQVLDYGRFLKPKMALAVLLPEKPTEDLRSLLEENGVGCTYESRRGVFRAI